MAGGPPVMVVALAADAALVEEEVSGEALAHGVAGAGDMAGKERTGPPSGPDTLALMPRAPRMSSACFKMMPKRSKKTWTP
jgi:hypothetical protein